MGLRQLLKQEHVDTTVKHDRVRALAQKFFDSYKTYSMFRSKHDAFVRVMFNGNSRIEISFDGTLSLTVAGFGMRNHPRAKLSPVAGCSDEGLVKYDESQLEQIVNDLAEYEGLYPIR